MWVIFARMALGSLIFLAAWRWRGRIDYQPGDWKWLLGLAACEPCLYFIFESLALQHTSAAQAGMITALLPLLVAVGAFFLLHEKIARNTWLGFALAVLGALWLTLASESDGHAPQPLLGNFYAAPRPGDPAFVEVGDKVTEDTVVGIIEVMKLMNSVRAGVAGTVVAILAQNGSAVEEGQPLVRIRREG